MNAMRDLTLILLYLASWIEKTPFGGQRRSWKTYPFHILDQLEDEGLITSSHRAKSVWFTEAGEKEALSLLQRYGLSPSGDDLGDS